jgi:hypothetical protein
MWNLEHAGAIYLLQFGNHVWSLEELCALMPKATVKASPT